MSVGSFIGGGFRLVRMQPRLVGIWAALYLALMTVAMIVLRPLMGSFVEFQRTIQANAALGITTPPDIPVAMFATFFALELAFCIIFVVFFAAVVRAITQPTGDKFAYLRFGVDELLLIALGFILVVAAIVAEIVLVIAILAIGGLVVVILGKAAAAVTIGVVAIGLFCAAIYAQVRLSLVGAFTVMQHKIVIREAWRATKGQFWTLFVTYLILGIGMVVAVIVIFAVTSPQLLSAYASMNSEAMNTAVQEQMIRQYGGLSMGSVLTMVVQALLGVAILTVYFGTVAAAALELGATLPADMPDREPTSPPSTPA